MMRTAVAVAFCSWALVAVVPVTAEEWGHLSGTLVFDGPIPTPVPENITKDQEFCGKHNLVDEALVVNPENGGVANVVVYLYQSRGDAAPPVHPSYAKTAQAEVVLDNSKCRFDPHICLVRTTQTLVLGNKDPIPHNSKVDTFVNPAINPIIPAGGKFPHKFTEPERLPAQVTCSIHPWMNGWIVVKDHPYSAASDKDGKFTIKNLPAGKWTFQFWQEKAGYLQQVTVGGKPAEWSRGRVEIEIKPGENDLGQIKLAPAVFEKD